jgi:RIO-like serine/threonine protein kinase
MEAQVDHRIHRGSATKAAIKVLDWQGRRLVVKDVQREHPLIRLLWGRPLLRREQRILAGLQEFDGVPPLYGRIDENAVAFGFVDGVPLRSVLGEDLLRSACLDLETKVRALHAEGVVHLDLKQRRNILVRESGQVTLIDFESSVRCGRGRWGRLLQKVLQPLDEAALLKFKSKYAAGRMSSEERLRARRWELLGKLWIFNRLSPLVRFFLGGGKGGQNLP